jgi:hypothetical protein
VVGDVVEQWVLLEQGSTLLETHCDDGTVDFGGFVHWRAGQHPAIQLQRPDPVVRAFVDTGKLASKLDHGINTEMRTAHSVVPPVLQFSRSYMDPMNSGSVTGVPRARDESDARLFLFRSYAFPSIDSAMVTNPSRYRP